MVSVPSSSIAHTFPQHIQCLIHSQLPLTLTGFFLSFFSWYALFQSVGGALPCGENLRQMESNSSCFSLLHVHRCLSCTVCMWVRIAFLWYPAFLFGRLYVGFDPTYTIGFVKVGHASSDVKPKNQKRVGQKGQHTLRHQRVGLSADMDEENRIVFLGCFDPPLCGSLVQAGVCTGCHAGGGATCLLGILSCKGTVVTRLAAVRRHGSEQIIQCKSHLLPFVVCGPKMTGERLTWDITGEI